VTFPDEPMNDTYQEERKKQCFFIHNDNTYIYIQGVTGGTDQTSGGCSLC